MLTLSQVILGVHDLEAASARFESYGLAVVDGGVHPGVGTANRVIPLGTSYLELLGVVDAELAAQSSYGRSLLARLDQTGGSDTLVRWSLRTDDIDGVAVRLGLAVERRRRVRPDGVELTWRAAGLEEALECPWLPFFMQWDHPDQYPGRPAGDRVHPAAPVAVTVLEVGPGTDGRFPQWVAGADAPLEVCSGQARLAALTLSTSRGDIRIS